MTVKNLENIMRLQEFEADPEESFIIQIQQQLLIMPIFRWVPTSDHWVDATGDFDLCMMKDQITYEFINKRSTREKYAYRYLAVFYLSNRLQAIR